MSRKLRHVCRKRCHQISGLPHVAIKRTRIYEYNVLGIYYTRAGRAVCKTILKIVLPWRRTDLLTRSCPLKIIVSNSCAIWRCRCCDEKKIKKKLVSWAIILSSVMRSQTQEWAQVEGSSYATGATAGLSIRNLWNTFPFEFFAPYREDRTACNGKEFRTEYIKFILLLPKFLVLKYRLVNVIFR